MTKHPDTRLARRKLAEKDKFANAKKKKETREGRVWRKLHQEYAKKQEAEDQLRNIDDDPNISGKH